MKAQLLCLPHYLGDEELAERVSYAWAGLSGACHQHPYELPPTCPAVAPCAKADVGGATGVAGDGGGVCQSRDRRRVLVCRRLPTLQAFEPFQCTNTAVMVLHQRVQELLVCSTLLLAFFCLALNQLAQFVQTLQEEREVLAPLVPRGLVMSRHGKLRIVYSINGAPSFAATATLRHRPNAGAGDSPALMPLW